jgi:uncharacterized protein (DUF983 family)
MKFKEKSFLYHFNASRMLQSVFFSSGWGERLMVSTRFQRSLAAGTSQSCPNILFRALLERVYLKTQEACFSAGSRIRFTRRNEITSFIKIRV